MCESVCGCCFVVWRTLWPSSRVQILIGYEPKDSFIPWLLEVIYSPKLEVFFVLKIFVFVCEVVSDLEKGACPTNTFIFQL